MLGNVFFILFDVCDVMRWLCVWAYLFELIVLNIRLSPAARRQLTAAGPPSRRLNTSRPARTVSELHQVGDSYRAGSRLWREIWSNWS